MNDSPSRILVAVEPLMLADSLIRVLEAQGAEVMVDLRDDDWTWSGRFDAAVVTGDLPRGVRADLVIRLPGEENGAIVGLVQRGEGEFEVDMPDLPACIELLRAFCPPVVRG